MKFSVGDIVLLKKTGEEGMVVELINDEMLVVSVEGITFPAYIDDLDHPYLKWFTEKTSSKKSAPEQLPVEKPLQKNIRPATGIHLSFLPVFKTIDYEERVDFFKIHVLNETDYLIFLQYDLKLPDENIFTYSGSLHPFSHLYLHTVSFEQISQNPRFVWNCQVKEQMDLQPEKGVLRIKPAKLFEHIQTLLLENTPSFEYRLVKDFKILEKPSEIKVVQRKKLPLIKRKSPNYFQLDELPKYELDLHIEKLTSHHKKLSNAEKLQLQIQALERYLSLAIMHRQERMIIVHGLGKGKLREEVHKILAAIPEVTHFANEWLGGYGFGATEVHFRYS